MLVFFSKTFIEKQFFFEKKILHRAQRPQFFFKNRFQPVILIYF